MLTDVIPQGNGAGRSTSMKKKPCENEHPKTPTKKTSSRIFEFCDLYEKRTYLYRP